MSRSAAPGYLDLARADRGAAQRGRRCGSPTTSSSTKATTRLRCRGARRGARVARIRQVLRVLRERARARHRPRACRTACELYWNQGLLDVLLEYPIASDRVRLLDPPAARAAGPADVTIVLRFLPPGRRGAAPSSFTATRAWCGSIRAGTRRRCASSSPASCTSSTGPTTCCSCCAWSSRSGASAQLVLIVTAFTVAHSITLDRLGLRPRPERAVVPAADRDADRRFHPLHGARERRSAAASRGAGSSPSPSAWCTASRFSYALRESLQFAGSHLLTSLLAFNVGVELGQLLVLVLLVPALELLFRSSSPSASERSSCRSWWRTPPGTG